MSVNSLRFSCSCQTYQTLYRKKCRTIDLMFWNSGMKSTRMAWVWIYLDVEGSSGSSVGLFSCENIQKLILRETGRSKPPRHSSPALPSTLSPPPSYTASPWGQAHHVTKLRQCPRKKKRAIPAARFLETYISRQRLLGSNAEALRQTTHASSWWPLLFYVTISCTGPNVAGYTWGFFSSSSWNSSLKVNVSISYLGKETFFPRTALTIHV